MFSSGHSQASGSRQNGYMTAAVDPSVRWSDGENEQGPGVYVVLSSQPNADRLGFEVGGGRVSSEHL